MPEYIVTGPTLDAWPAVKEFVVKFNMSIFAGRINVSNDVFEKMYTASLIPGSVIGILILWGGMEVAGVAVLNETNEIVNMEFAKRTFLRGVYIQPGESFRAAVELNHAIDKWGRVRGHDQVYAYVRLNTAKHGDNGFKRRAVLKRFGYEPLFTTIGKSLVNVSGRKES